MGGKDSKPAFITYEDAIKRVTDAELKRLKDAFKRSSTLGGYMTKPIFVREVLGDGVPSRLTDQIYVAFGGSSKGLSFKDLLCGLVLLTRGWQEEKIKFLFGVYANEALTHVQKEEMDSLVLSTEGQSPQELSDLFRESDRVSYDQFKRWCLTHAQATSIMKWLLKDPCTVTLSNDLETPTFYQTLAGVTHLEESDIIELEKRYWMLKAQSKTGKFDLDTFKPIVCPPLPESLCEALFMAFDENRDNHIDFKEMACGISACCRGPQTERQKFCFKVFDEDFDGLLSRAEIEEMVGVMLLVRQQNKSPEELETDGMKDVTIANLTSEILEKYDSDKDGHITQEEYLVWTVTHPLPEEFLHLLFEVCHVVLGLKPLTKEEEGQVIIGWLEREERQGLKMGHTWYLVSMNWWKQWLDYVQYKPVQAFADPNVPNNNNNQSDAYKKSSSHIRASSLCPNLSRKSSMTSEDQSYLGYVVNYSTLPNAKASQTAITSSPTKYATLPRSTLPSGVAMGSPLRGVKSMPGQTSHSQSATPCGSGSNTPVPSPRMGKRGVWNPGGQKPAAIDNTALIAPVTTRVSTLTNEGGRLKRDRMLARGRDFELLPDAVWKALSAWYGGSPALPRNVIIPSHSDTAELELYPISVRLLRHQTTAQRPNQPNTFTGMMGGIGGMVASYTLECVLKKKLAIAAPVSEMKDSTGLGGAQPAAPRRYLAYTAAFSRKHTLEQVYDFLTGRLRISREDMRLWKFKDEASMLLLEEEEFTMEELGIDENMQLLIEVRNKDLTWPEELSQLAKNKAVMDKQVPTERGATGLNNLGNTCFMNSALQCVSNTRILTYYFTGGMHLYEINRTNPLGMKGHIAQRYGDLIKDLWSGTTKSIAPLKLRWTIGKYAPRFNGFQQQDSQELLAFLLDGLHEDLNRVHDKPYVELKDSDGRPDTVVAKEALENHLIRNRSIVVDLFHGQLKSCVSCTECGSTSVRFDPFTFLSLPLPMESCIHLEIIVARLDGGVPVKYGLRLNMDEKYRGLKKTLSEMSGIPTPQILLVEIFGALIKSFPQDTQKVKTLLGGNLYAYEMPPMAPIPTMTATEERSLSPAKVQCGLNQIQRMPQKPVSRESSAPLLNGNDSNHSSPAHRPSANGDAPTNGQMSNCNGLVNGLANGVSGNHTRNVSNVTCNSVSTETSAPTVNFNPSSSGFIVAVHRKMIRMDVYFLSSQKTRPSLFGTPLILPCEESTSHHDLYRNVWTQVSRLVSPLPPSELATSNHAQDCDDSLGYEYPFTLKVVQKDGFTCAWCPWFRFCRGCKIECNMESFNFGSACVAVDWEPTALHLRYQTSQERIFQDHSSVEESRRLQTEPIDLDTCLRAFTKEEQLGEDEQVYCSKCKKHRLAAKKLQLWKLPPILIIHLKRFQFLNGRWVKSQKIVKFPFSDFDPTNFVVQRTPTGDVQCNGSDAKLSDTNGSTNHNTNNTSESSDSGIENNNSGSEVISSKSHRMNGDAVPLMNGDIASEEDPPSLTPVHSSQVKVKPKVREEDNVSEDSSRSSDEHDEQNEDYSNVRYNLYAMSCHTGILGGGHYVTYAKNPNDKWYLYNDSSCKEIPVDHVDTNSSYILFYERRGLDYGTFMPDVTDKEPDTADIEDEFESDFKKMCVIQ